MKDPWSLPGRSFGAEGSILVSWSAAMDASGCILGRSGTSLGTLMVPLVLIEVIDVPSEFVK